jgi:hypothetical protein
MGWFHVSEDRLRYRGQLLRDPFAAWVKTSEGADAVNARATRDGLRVFAHARTRRRIWKELAAAATSEPLRSAIQEETEHFSTALVDASYAPALPRLTVARHRLVIVPRTLIAGRIRGALRRRLNRLEPFATFDTGVREFFCEQLLVEIDAAVGECRPSARRPVLTRDVWGCIGRDDGYQWVDPIFAGPGWGGHLLMFEFPRQSLSRTVRNDLEQAVRELQNSLSNISRLQREGIIRAAVNGLPAMTA